MEIFDLLGSIGMNPATLVNAGVIAGVILLSNLLKEMLPLPIPARLVPLIPTLLGSAATFAIANPLTLQNYWNTWLMYVPLATYLFKMGKTTIAGK